MGLSTIFGRNTSTRERPPRGLRHVRHTGRAQRLSFGRQLRTFMCFTTEEKLAQGGGSGDKRRAKSGSLSQRLQLTDSSEDNSCSPMEPLRPSTCPPDPPSAALSDRPSSFTLSSLDDQQLNTYLEVLFRRCAKGQLHAAARNNGQDLSSAATGSGEQLEGAAPPAEALVAAAESVSGAAPEAAAGDERVRRPTLQECQELIRRHEQLFGPIATSRPAPLPHSLHQPATALPEPCKPPEPEASHLSTPQHGAALSCDEEWNEWRRHFSSGPEGVWRVVGHDPSTNEIEQLPAAAKTETLPSVRPRRLFGTLRNKCSSLFRYEQKPSASDVMQVEDVPLESDTDTGERKQSTEEFVEKTLSETKSDDVLKSIVEEEIVPCITGEQQRSAPEQPEHDPEVYREGAFRPWSRFFRRSGSEGPVTELPAPDEPGPTTTCTSDTAASGVPPQPAEAAAADSLPASLWWGVSPLSEAGLPALRDQLRHDGLERLLERLDGPADRQTVWLSRPELPQLFTAAGLGPADMTRWLLRVPNEREDDDVPLQTASQQPDQQRGTGRERPDDESTPHATPRAKFFEELMGTSESDPVVSIQLDRGDEMESSIQTKGDEHNVIKQTETSDLATGLTPLSSGWGARSNDDLAVKAQSQDLGTSSSSPAMPLCSDVCTFLMPKYQKYSRGENTGNQEATPDAKLAYETYGTEHWGKLGAERSRDVRSERQPKPATTVPVSDSADRVSDRAADPTVPVPDRAPKAAPVSRLDSETELGENLSSHMSEFTPAAADAECHHTQLRNSSVRPIDSEVDIAQVLHEQSGYATLGESTAPASGGYQSLPLHEVDSETELGLALPLTETGPLLSAAEHCQVAAYDSETEMAALMASLPGTDSETEMAEQLRRLASRQAVPEGAHGRDVAADRTVDGELRHDLSPQLGRVAAPAGSVARLPAAPVRVDSETEMGVVLRLFEQGLLSSRYFADVPLPDELDSDLDDPPAQDQKGQKAHRNASNGHAGLPLSFPLNDIYNTSKTVSKNIISKALFLLGGLPLTPLLARTGSSPFGPSSGLDGLDLEREAATDGGETGRTLEGACDPYRVIPEVNLTTSDGSFVVLFPPRPVDPTAVADDTSYYETDEGLMLRLERKQPQRRAAVESRGFKPTEASLSLSERQLSAAERCSAAARRRRSPSPRTRASDDGSLRVLYRAETSEAWPPVSPEGLSGLSLSPADPELAALRWRKSSRGEDGDPEAWSSGEAASASPPAESRSQTELRKGKTTPPSAVGANSWC